MNGSSLHARWAVVRSEIALTCYMSYCSAWCVQNKQYMSCISGDVCLMSCVQRVALCECEDRGVKSVGSVAKVRGMEICKNGIENQNGRVPVRLRLWVQMCFLSVSSWFICILNFVLVCACLKCEWLIWALLPVSSRWRYGYGTILMERCIQGDTLYMCEQFDVDGKFYIEVIRSWWFMVKHQNGQYHHTHQVWRRWKLLITFHLQGHKMMLAECEDCGIKSVGEVC